MITFNFTHINLQKKNIKKNLVLSNATFILNTDSMINVKT